MILLDEVDAQDKFVNDSEGDHRLRFIGVHPTSNHLATLDTSTTTMSTRSRVNAVPLTTRRPPSVRSHHESLPPYTPRVPPRPSPFLQHGNATRVTDRHVPVQQVDTARLPHLPNSSANPTPEQAYLHPRSASSSRLSPASSSRTLLPSPNTNSNTLHRHPDVSTTNLSLSTPSSASTTLLPLTPSPSSFTYRNIAAPQHASTLSLPFISTYTQVSDSLIGAHLITPRSAPPPTIRPVNNVHIKRRSAVILGTYVLDPSMFVPECLLPPSTNLSSNGKQSLNGKGKTKRRRNLTLVTDSGDICAEVWIRDGCATAVSRRTVRATDEMQREDVYNEEFNEYWSSGWDDVDMSDFSLNAKSPKQSGVDILVKSESGNIMLKVHAPRSQRICIYASSSHGSVTVGLPRTFSGPIFTSRDLPVDDEFSAYHDESTNIQTESSYRPSYRPNRERTATESEFDYYDDDAKSNFSEFSAKNALMNLVRVAPPLQMSAEMESSVSEHSDRSRGSGAMYVVGDARDRWDPLDAHGWDGDELHIAASHGGSVGVSFNDEALMPLANKGGSLNRLARFLTKASRRS